MKSVCRLAFILSPSALASQVDTTADFVNAASAALAIDDLEVSQLSHVTEQQKMRDYNSVWDGVGALDSTVEVLQKRNASSNATMASSALRQPSLQINSSSGVAAKLGRSEASQGEVAAKTQLAINTPNGTPSTVENSSGSSSSEHANAKAVGAIGHKNGVPAKIKFAPQTGRGPLGKTVASVADRNSGHVAWTKTWKSSAGNATPKVLHKVSHMENITTANGHLAPQTGQFARNVAAKRHLDHQLGNVSVDAHRHRHVFAIHDEGVQSKTPLHHASENSLVGSMAAAIKQSAFELKNQQAETKHEQAEAKHELTEAKLEQERAKLEHEDAKREHLETIKELTMATRAADAAFSADAISSMQAVRHSRLRPRRQQPIQQQIEAPTGGQLQPTSAPETVLGMPQSKIGIAKPSSQHRRVQTPARRRGVAWKMFGSKEWIRSSAASRTGTRLHRTLKRRAMALPVGGESTFPSSVEVLNANLAVALGAQGVHAPEHSRLEINQQADVENRVDALAKALEDRVAPAL